MNTVAIQPARVRGPLPPLIKLRSPDRRRLDDYHEHVRSMLDT